jgi:hypothetical protein
MLNRACEEQVVRSQSMRFGKDARRLSLVKDIKTAAAPYRPLQALAEDAVNAVIAAVRVAGGWRKTLPGPTHTGASKRSLR